MAEIPAFRERATVDGAGGLEPYAARRATERARQIHVTIDGRRPRRDPHLADGRLAARAPAACRCCATPPGTGWPVRHRGADGSHRVALDVFTYRDRIGWHELVVRASSGAAVSGATAPADDQADELRSYPRGLLQSPPQVTSRALRLDAGRRARAPSAP